MRHTRLGIRWIGALLAAVLAGTGGCMLGEHGEAVDRGDGDADTDGDTDLDADGDTDVDADGDTDVDADTDTDTGTDMGTDEEPPDEEPPENACDLAEEEDVVLFLSADDSNSQADAVRSRQLVESGRRIEGPQRLYEFLNYYTFDYVPAEPGTLRIVPQLRAKEGEEGSYSMLVGVVAPFLDPADRRPMNVVFSVDSSGSMRGEPIARARDVMRAVAGELREGDVVSVVSWDDRTSILLENEWVSGPNDRELMEAIADVVEGGSTNLDQGLSTAYTLASATYLEGGLNRVILISDGGANTGETSEELIAEHADEAEQEGIFLVGVGTSVAAYNDLLMDTVTDLGKGAYVYVDSAAEAEAAFTGYRFLSNMEIHARDVQLEMTIPAGWVIDEFHGEEISDDPKEVEPQHLAPDDAMLYHMDLADCAAESHDGQERFAFSVTWKDSGGRMIEDEVAMTVTEMLDAPANQLAKADAIVSYASALHDVYWLPEGERRAHLDGVYSMVEATHAALNEDADLGEILRLLDIFRNRF